MEPSRLSGRDSATSALPPPADGEAMRTARGRLDHARAVFAASVSIDVPSPTLGDVVLREDQIDTVQRVRAQLRRDGGCLLADDVGTGKTYVALTVARDWARPLVVAPASLRTTWARAAERAGVRCAFASHEGLSRGRAPEESFDGIVVDESHRFRATSRRHAVLARLAARVPVLMLSATPLQNRLHELADQLAMFLGEVAYRLGPLQLTRWVVRSATTGTTGLPRVAPPRWLPIDADDGDVLRAILALPPPPRAADAGDGGVLVQLSLVRAWASSRGALAATVRRRQRTLAAIEQCHQEGRLPTRRELRSWECGGEVQLGFPSLLAASGLSGRQQATLAQAIEHEREALDCLLCTIAATRDADTPRVAALRQLRHAHADASILAFSEWTATIRAYSSAFREEAGVGSLTASEARIASGRVSREELLERFAPHAQGARMPAAHDRVTLLLATDLLSEGVNLQDASVVVHLDLPWNPARLAQRLGRIRRLGGASEIASYLVAPPAPAALLLRTERRLRAKLARAEAIVGRSIAVIPALDASALATLQADPHGAQCDSPASSLSTAERRSEIVRRLLRWRAAGTVVVEAPEDGDGCTIAAVVADTWGWIALLDDGRLVAALAHGDRRPTPSGAPEMILTALELADGEPRRETAVERDCAQRAVDEFIALDWTQRSSGLEIADTPLRRRMLRLLEATLRAAPRHRRATIVGCAARVRHALTCPLPLGIERELDALAGRRSASADWVEAADAILARGLSARESVALGRSRCRALILLGR